MGFEASVEIGGTEARGIVLNGARITHGKQFRDEAPLPSTAIVTIVPLTARANLPGTYPGLGFGDSIASGFIDTYVDEYEGGESRLTIGTPVVVKLTTDTGYVSTRFSGFIAAIDYEPQQTTLTLVNASEALTRKMLLPAAWPSESEVARVQRIATGAGIPITIEGINTAVLSKYPEGDRYVSAWDLLTDVANDCNGLLYTNRTGAVIYRTRAADMGRTVVELPSEGTLSDNLTMTSEAGTVMNSVTVTYPALPEDVSYTVEDATSIQKYGKRAEEFSVSLVQASAESFAQRRLNLWKDPVWAMPSATVVLALADEYKPGAVVETMQIDLDDEVLLPRLTPSAPTRAYQSRVLGYIETIDRNAWSLTFTLDPFGWTWRAPDDAPPPPPVVGPSKNPALIPRKDNQGDYVTGQFEIINYDGNLTYVAQPLAGTTGTATLNAGSGVYTVSDPNGQWSVTTTEPGSEPGIMRRRQYTSHIEDRGWWVSVPVTVPGGTYAAATRPKRIVGDPAVLNGGNYQCPEGWTPEFTTNDNGVPGVFCVIQVPEYYCDKGGVLSGTVCTLPPTLGTEQQWVSNPVEVRDATPAGWIDTTEEWVRTE